MNKFILGAGISGLIYNYYNPEYIIISPEVGGKFNSPGMENTILLHDCDDTVRLLSDLSITNFTRKTHIIKYAVSGIVKNNLTDDEKIIFIKKKVDDDNFVVKDKNLSTSDYYIPIIEVDIKELIEKLSVKINIIKDKVIRITKTEIVCELNRYSYDEIVSTLPAPVFWSLYNKSRKFNYKPVTFLLVDKLPKDIATNDKIDLLYIVDKDNPISRINKRRDNYLCECTGIVEQAELTKLFSEDTKVLSYYVDNYGIIFTDENNIPPKNIRFVGRFAVWNHRYKIHDSVRDATKKYSFESIYNEQLDFNSNFFDYNVKDEELKQQLLREFIINLGEEIGEFGRLVLKKNHRKFEEPDRNLVLHEYIDMFKYVLGIASVYGFTIDDIYSAFWDKSELVRKRYEKYKGEQK